MHNLALLLMLLSPIAEADSRSAYRDALRVAQARVERTQEARVLRQGLRSGNPLAPSFINELQGRAYKVGDRWKVAAWNADPAQMRHTSDPAHMRGQGGRGGVFLYEVVKIGAGLAPDVELKVTQLDEAGFPRIDTRVRHVTMSLTEDYSRSRKEYRLEDGKTFVADPDGMHAPMSYLELLPLEAPELASAIRGMTDKMPEIPAPLQKLWKERGRELDLARAAHFEQDDFFGRRIEAYWLKGNPWPSVLKTPNGIAFLLKD